MTTNYHKNAVVRAVSAVCPLHCWSHLLVVLWWEIDDHPSISEWTDTLDDSSPEILEEDVKKSDQSMNWLCASWIVGNITCFVIRKTHHPYVLHHNRRTGWGRLVAHGPPSVFNDRRREEKGRRNQTHVLLMPLETTKAYRHNISFRVLW